MKMILTIKDVEKLAVAYLTRSGQLSGDVKYEVKIEQYSKDFMTIQPAEETKEDK